MSNSSVIDSILRLHDKIDDLKTDITEIKVAQANLPCGARETRLRIIERIVYGAVAIVLIGFMVSIAGSPTGKSQAKTTPIMREMTR